MIRVMSKKVKTFFHVLTKSSFPQPAYYRKIIKTKFSFSLKYFIVLIWFLNLLFFGLVFAGLQPKSQSSWKEIVSAIKSYPSNLSIEIRNGVLTTNYDHPYFLWLESGQRKTLLAVVNQTATTTSVQNFTDSPLVFTNRDLVIFNNSQDKTNPTIIPYGQLNLNINKQVINSWLAIFNRLLPLLIVLFLIFTLFITPLFATLGAFICLMLISLFCFFVFSIYSKKHTYIKTLQISLHAATVPYIVKYGLLAFGYDLGRAWPVFMFLIVVFLFSALYETYLDK
jgi:hypothetical protein